MTGSIVMTPRSFLLLVVCVFSSFSLFFFSLLSLARGLSVYCVFSKNQLLASLVFFIDFLFSISLIFALVFTVSCPLLVFGLSYPLSFSKHKFWLLISDLSSFGMYAVYLLQSAHLDKLCFYFHSVQNTFQFLLRLL